MPGPTKSFERILTFLGLTETREGKIAEGTNFAGRARAVWASPNHNWLRVTRILRSLTLLGLAPEAQKLYEWLAEAYRQRTFPIDVHTFGYWTGALS